MRALWKDQHVTFNGKYHTIDDTGINPRPLSGHLPIWYGGHHDKTLPRIAKWGDGWIQNNFPPDQSAVTIIGELRRMVEAEGRDPGSVGIEKHVIEPIVAVQQGEPVVFGKKPRCH